MKKYFYLFALSVFANTGIAQTVPSDCTAPPNVVKQYADDADFMALQRIISIGNTYKDSINIPQVWTDTPMRAMLAVYNALALPARDSVVTQFRIHEYKAFTTHWVFINADSNETYMKQLKLSTVPTGDPAFDNLANSYPIKTIQYLPFGTGSNHSVSLELDSAYNSPVLANEYLNNLTGITSAVGTFNVQGDSNHIAYTITSNYVKLDYTRGWENCMDQNGCDKKRTWTFHVAWNCDVTFIGSSGDPVNPVSVNDVSKTHPFSIYPNPAANTLHVSGLQAETPYCVYNLQGRIVATGITAKDVDLSMIPAGNYMLRLNNTGLHFTKQ